MNEGSGSGSIHLWIRIRIQEAQKYTKPTDPDAQHCLELDELPREGKQAHEEVEHDAGVAVV